MIHNMTSEGPLSFLHIGKPFRTELMQADWELRGKVKEWQRGKRLCLENNPVIKCHVLPSLNMQTFSPFSFTDIIKPFIPSDVMPLKAKQQLSPDVMPLQVLNSFPIYLIDIFVIFYDFHCCWDSRGINLCTMEPSVLFLINHNKITCVSSF